MTQCEAIRDIHDRVRQCFTRHKFITFGDALSWWHETSYETQQLEIGEMQISQFSTDIMWLISFFGPKEPVDYKIMKTRIYALKATRDSEEVTNPSKIPPQKIRRRKRRF